MHYKKVDCTLEVSDSTGCSKLQWGIGANCRRHFHVMGSDRRCGSAPGSNIESQNIHFLSLLSIATCDYHHYDKGKLVVQLLGVLASES